MKFNCLWTTILILQLVTRSIQWDESIPLPSPWPERFHALLYMNLSTTHLQISNLWYDWPKGRNVNIMQKQLGELLYDVEWNNGTSFYYTLGAHGTCETMYFEVGIPRPDFLQGASYLGTELTDGFLCNVWEKVDFIWYYEDVVTKRPVRWDFYDGISTHVITFEVGAVLHDSLTQAPAYCFSQDKDSRMIKDVVGLIGCGSSAVHGSTADLRNCKGESNAWQMLRRAAKINPRQLFSQLYLDDIVFGSRLDAQISQKSPNHSSLSSLSKSDDDHPNLRQPPQLSFLSLPPFVADNQ